MQENLLSNIKPKFVRPVSLEVIDIELAKEKLANIEDLESEFDWHQEITKDNLDNVSKNFSQRINYLYQLIPIVENFLKNKNTLNGDLKKLKLNIAKLGNPIYPDRQAQKKIFLTRKVEGIKEKIMELTEDLEAFGNSLGDLIMACHCDNGLKEKLLELLPAEQEKIFTKLLPVQGKGLQSLGAVDVAKSAVEVFLAQQKQQTKPESKAQDDVPMVASKSFK